MRPLLSRRFFYAIFGDMSWERQSVMWYITVIYLYVATGRGGVDV